MMKRVVTALTATKRTRAQHRNHTPRV
jgi:hypothetical protein